MTNFDDFPLRSYSSYKEYVVDSESRIKEKYVRGYFPIKINSDNVNTSTHQICIPLPKYGDIIERLYFDTHPTECVLKYTQNSNECNEIELLTKQNRSSIYVDLNLPIHMYPNIGFTCCVHYDFAPPAIHCTYGRINDKNLCLTDQFLICHTI